MGQSGTMTPPSRPPLVLGSTSAYRRELLARLRLDFSTDAPQVDETPHADETPAGLAQRLALEKARDVAGRHPGAVVIGADQVADLSGVAIGKPGNHANAVAQLQAMRGQRVLFHTAVAVLRPATGFAQALMATVAVQFRTLSDAEITRYLQLEQPYDCAGSAKSEGLGIALLSSIESDDPTALVGLPLIRACQMIRAAGIPLLTSKSSGAGTR